MDAVALVHIAPEVVFQTLDASPEAEAKTQDAPRFEVRVGADGKPYRMRRFEDATAVFLGVRLDHDVDVMSALIGAALGDLIDQHTHPRGVPVYPASYEPKSTNWNDLIEELGEAADWIPMETPAEIVDDPMAGIFGMLGPQAGELAQLAGLGGQDPQALMQQAMQLAQQLAGSGALSNMQHVIQQMASSPGGMVDAELSSEVGQLGFDLEAMTQQAQTFLDANPELEQRLREQFGMGDDDPDDGEAK